MIELYKNVLGIAADTTEYDVYIAVICAIAITWVAKSVISAVYNVVLHIFR